MKTFPIIADYNGFFFPLFFGFPAAIVAVVFLLIACVRAFSGGAHKARTPAIIGVAIACLSAVIFYFGKKYGP